MGTGAGPNVGDGAPAVSDTCTVVLGVGRGDLGGVYGTGSATGWVHLGDVAPRALPGLDLERPDPVFLSSFFSRTTPPSSSIVNANSPMAALRMVSNMGFATDAGVGLRRWACAVDSMPVLFAGATVGMSD